MTHTLEAVLEGGVLRPLTPVKGLPEGIPLRVTVEPIVNPNDDHPLLRFAGVLSDDEANEVNRIVADEFERVEPHGW